MEGTASKPKPTVVRDTLWEKENGMLPVFFIGYATIVYNV
jgi:hypothetical protein